MSCFNKCLALMVSSAPPHIETISLNSKLTVSHMIHCFPSTAFPNSMSIGNCVDEAEEGAERGMAWQVRRRGEVVLQRDAPRPRQLQLGVGGAHLPCIHFRCDPVSAVVGERNYGSECAGLHAARQAG